MRFDHLGIVVPNLQIGRDRNEKEVQTGHSFDIHFNMRVVNDELVYEDESKKSLGYESFQNVIKNIFVFLLVEIFVDTPQGFVTFITRG